MKKRLLLLILAVCILISAVFTLTEVFHKTPAPSFSQQPFTEIDGGVPQFSQSEIVTEAFESYAPLDLLGRCGTAFACIGRELMPTEERGSIGQVKPSGWHTVKYDCVDGKYLYNRCHLIGFQLTGENANEKNLVTGTRYMNTEGMLPFENMVADYVRETGNHVMYRVIPDFQGSELVCRGVIMEALSVEDGGEGISFRVYCHNVQPGVEIDYKTGKSHLQENTEDTQGEAFVLNTSSKRIHKPSCEAVENMSPKNRKDVQGALTSYENQGYEKCGSCF